MQMPEGQLHEGIAAGGNEERNLGKLPYVSRSIR